MTFNATEICCFYIVQLVCTNKKHFLTLKKKEKKKEKKDKKKTGRTTDIYIYKNINRGTYDRYIYIYIYINMKIPPLYSLVWGSLRLAPIMSL